jgi:hypothetical protein
MKIRRRPISEKENENLSNAGKAGADEGSFQEQELQLHYLKS